MKGNEKIIQALNSLLADELTAINQYMVHSEMAANWGYEKLHEHFEKRAIDEMKHAEKLIGRILFLEGIPTVSELPQDPHRRRRSQVSSRTTMARGRRGQGLQRCHRARPATSATSPRGRSWKAS